MPRSLARSRLLVQAAQSVLPPCFAPPEPPAAILRGKLAFGNTPGNKTTKNARKPQASCIIKRRGEARLWGAPRRVNLG